MRWLTDLNGEDLCENSRSPLRSRPDRLRWRFRSRSASGWPNSQLGRGRRAARRQNGPSTVVAWLSPCRDIGGLAPHFQLSIGRSRLAGALCPAQLQDTGVGPSRQTVIACPQRMDRIGSSQAGDSLRPSGIGPGFGLGLGRATASC